MPPLQILSLATALESACGKSIKLVQCPERPACLTFLVWNAVQLVLVNHVQRDFNAGVESLLEEPLPKKAKNTTSEKNSREVEERLPLS